MTFKRFYKRSGYQGTVKRFLEGKPFVRGLMRESLDNQLLELFCQFYICKSENGYHQRICDHNKCMGVPICSKKVTK